MALALEVVEHAVEVLDVSTDVPAWDEGPLEDVDDVVDRSFQAVEEDGREELDISAEEADGPIRSNELSGLTLTLVDESNQPKKGLREGCRVIREVCKVEDMDIGVANNLPKGPVELIGQAIISRDFT